MCWLFCQSRSCAAVTLAIFVARSTARLFKKKIKTIIQANLGFFIFYFQQWVFNNKGKNYEIIEKYQCSLLLNIMYIMYTPVYPVRVDTIERNIVKD